MVRLFKDMPKLATHWDNGKLQALHSFSARSFYSFLPPCKFIDIRWCSAHKKKPKKKSENRRLPAVFGLWVFEAHSNSTHFRDALILLVSGHLHKYKKRWWVANHWPATPTAPRGEGGGIFHLLTFNYFRDKQTQTEGSRKTAVLIDRLALLSAHNETFPFNHFVA